MHGWCGFHTSSNLDHALSVSQCLISPLQVFLLALDIPNPPNTWGPLKSAILAAVWGVPILDVAGCTVDGRNPVPPNMYGALQIMRYLPYQLVHEFFHQPYVSNESGRHLSNIFECLVPLSAVQIKRAVTFSGPTLCWSGVARAILSQTSAEKPSSES